MKIYAQDDMEDQFSIEDILTVQSRKEQELLFLRMEKESSVRMI